MVNVRGIATEAAAAIVERLIGIAPASRDAVAAAVAEALKRWGSHIGRKQKPLLRYLSHFRTEKPGATFS